MISFSALYLIFQPYTFAPHLASLAGKTPRMAMIVFRPFKNIVKNCFAGPKVQNKMAASKNVNNKKKSSSSGTYDYIARPVDFLLKPLKELKICTRKDCCYVYLYLLKRLPIAGPSEEDEDGLFS